MALNINTIKQASPKANQVATEQYVDTSIAAIDVSSDISANNDIFAQKLGYLNYASMVAAATAGQTIITGGYVNTSLISAGAINAGMINTYNLTASNATIQNGMISNAMITDASITNAKIADASITNAKIADASITNAKIADASITNAKIADASITNAKIANLSVDTLKIQDEAVIVPRYASGNGSTSIIYTPAVTHTVYFMIAIPFTPSNSLIRFYVNGNRIYNFSNNLGASSYSGNIPVSLNAGVSYTFIVTATASGEYEDVPLYTQLLMLGIKK